MNPPLSAHLINCAERTIRPCIMVMIVGQGGLPAVIMVISSGPRAIDERFSARSSGVPNGESNRRESPSSWAIRLSKFSSVIFVKN